MSRATDPVVKISNATKEFGDVVAVNEIDLEINEGELVTLLGPSGCGKTTTLRAIAGLESLSDGIVFINGDDVTAEPAYQRDTGMVFQHFALFPHMTVADNIAFGLEMENVGSGEIERRTRRALSMVQLEELGDRYPKNLSGGQQQRVALARALVIEPSVLLMDEPLSDLDKKLREDMRLEILRLHRQLDVTMIYVTHNQKEALQISDRMVIMSEGSIHQVGTPAEIYKNPADAFVAEFIGDTNMLEGTVQQTDEYIEVDVGLKSKIIIDKQSWRGREEATAGDRVILILRPEYVNINSERSGRRGNMVEGTVTQRIFSGSEESYYVDVGTCEFEVVETDHTNIGSVSTGDYVYLSFDRTSPILIGGSHGE
jgi:spermidine/putrescine ABC transporter ATP-binding subunit